MDGKEKIKQNEIRYGIEERLRIHERRKETYKRALHLRKKGLKCREIAERLDIPLGTIKRWVCGISRLSNRKVTLEILEKIKELRKKNIKVIAIAKMYGIHPTTVVEYSRKLGIVNKKVAKKLDPTFIQRIIDCVEEEGLKFLNYFYWKPIRPKDIIRFLKFIECLKLFMKGEKPQHIDKKLKLPIGTTQCFITGRCSPKVLQFLKIYKEMGKPKDGCLWLNLNVTRGGKIPEDLIIQAPRQVKCWEDVKWIITQLEPIQEAYERGLKFKLSKEEINQQKYRFFAYLLGAFVGDCNKHKPKKGCIGSMHIELKLSKAYEANFAFGEFVSLCANAIGLRMNKVKDKIEDKGECCCWRSQSSPLISYMFNILLGLKNNETTTYDPIKMKWFLTAPKEVKIFFLQGIADSDGWVSVPKQAVGIETYPNSELVQKLLESINIKCHKRTTRKGRKLVVIKGFNQIKNIFSLPIFSYFVKSHRYQILEKLANSQHFSSIWPIWLEGKIKEYAKLYKPSQISRKILEEYNVSIRADRISEKIKSWSNR